MKECMRKKKTWRRKRTRKESERECKKTAGSSEENVKDEKREEKGSQTVAMEKHEGGMR